MDDTSTSSSTIDPTVSTGPNIPTTNRLRIPPPVVALGLLIVGLILHSLARTPQTVFAHHILGLLIVSAGAGLCAYAAAIFAVRDTTKNPNGEPTAFVTIAPYTFTRNPMYLGLTLILFGFAIFFGSIVMLLAPIAFLIIIDRMVIPFEEQNLERLFGPSYVEYKIRVRRWV